jgi:hypothetical protein
MVKRSEGLGVLAWGLRHYAWVVLLTAVAIAFAVSTMLQQAVPRYEATAQAGPTGRVRLPNIDALPKIGESAFANVYSSEDVLRVAGVDSPDQLTSDDIELVASADNLIYTIVARADDAQEAQDLADEAARQFVNEMNKYTETIGSYAVKTLAQRPTQPSARLGPVTSWGIGLLSGLVAGFGVVGMILLLRRPVIDSAGTEEAVGVPVFARITLQGGRSAVRTGMAPLCRLILSEPTDLVLFVGPPNTLKDRVALSEELVRWLGRVRRVVPLRRRLGGEALGTASLTTATEAGPGGEARDLLVVDDASPVDVATRPERSLTLLVAKEGIPQRSFNEYADQYLNGDDTAILLVAKRSRLSGGHGSRRRAASRSRTMHQPPRHVDEAVGHTEAPHDTSSNEPG